ncbi:MAG TPA: ATP-binding protein [Anaeromyxobacteraceae bacterium]|nr:ATP-binding protein [Anaeromyxobacteraceae bacterium]
MTQTRSSFVEYLRAAAIIAATTAVAAGTRALFHVPDIEMLFLLGVVLTALTSSRKASLAAAALAVVAYDFFFVPPPFTLDVADARYLLTFGMMFGVSLIVATLTHRLREGQHAAFVREHRSSVLYALTRGLGAAGDERGVAEACVEAAAAAFDAEAVFFRVRGDQVAPVAAMPASTVLEPSEMEVARWVVARGQPAGLGADVLAAEPVLCAPVRAWGEVAAVLAVRPQGARIPDVDERSLLEAMGRQAALALDRVRLSEEARQSTLRAETERLRSGLLSAVSHDFRTPLAAVVGAATTLRDEADVLDDATRRELTEAICDEAERLERLVSNLLDMTRLDSGAVEPKREWVPLDEVLGSALGRLERMLAGRQVTTTLHADAAMVSIDPILIEQLIVNLLENAAKYTPSNSVIELSAARAGAAVVLDVSDRGPGIPAGEEERIFERFRRGAHPGVRGVGLGLAVSRAIATAHGGTLVASGRPGGGATFRLTLPLPAEPPPLASDPVAEGAS